MSQKDFKNLFLENILNFLWRQWSAMGVLGEARTKDQWIYDPEPMLLFTLEMGRYEPRLFDEVMDWLVVNGKWIDMQRLRGVLREKDKGKSNLMGAVSAFLMKQGQERKWKNLKQFCMSQLPDNPNKIEALFYKRDGTPHPMSNKPDPDFLAFRFNRPKLEARRMTRDVQVTSNNTLRFLVRGLFGIGSRAECLAYLLTHDGGHPSEVAKNIGLSVRGTQDALIELSRSGLVLTRVKGKRKIEYWLSQDGWWAFLSRGIDINRPVWIDWISLYNGLSKVWAVLNEIEQGNLSDYMRSSKLRDSLETVGNEFSKSGLDVPPLPGKDVKPEDFERAFENFIINVFGAD